MKHTDRTQGDYLTAAYIRQNGSICACIPTTPFQKVYYFLLMIPLVLLLMYRWDYFLFAVSVYLMLIYALAAFLRFTSAVRSLGKHAEYRVTPEELSAVPDSDLPVYTVLVPLYHEEAVASKILKRLGALDYPKDKLDVKLLLEADDDETRSALAREVIPEWCSVVTVPDGSPRTKPRACNYGLEAAKGEFLVIYDAEDAPESDQLRKALAVFRQDRTGKLICVQAKLNFYNAKQNLLTRLFTIEYSTNFDMQLPGLVKYDLPLPLGGTSNHFRVKELRELAGWDPFNVTEDCDLGIRIYEHGYRTAVVESTTWEEANPHLGNWIRQRSRWVKGFLQSHLVHYRNPFGTIRRLGSEGSFAAANLVCTNVAAERHTGSRIDFVADAEGIGALDFSGSAEIGANARLSVDLSAYSGGRRSFRLIGCSSRSGEFAEMKVIGLREDLAPARFEWTSRGLYLKTRKDLTMFVR